MNSWIANWSGLWLTSTVVAMLAAALWWIIRKRRRELRLPIIRILKLPQTKLPRIVVRKPPLIPFIAFLLAAIAFALWTARPRNRIFANHNPNQLRVHIFVDMSPSVASHVTPLELARTVSGLWPSIGGSSRISMSTSHSDTIYEVRDSSQVEDLIQGLGFHRAGVRIGSALKSHLAQTGEVDRLLIVSDRDQHSWTGFQWQYLQDDAEVFFVNIDNTSETGVKPNIFVNNVRRVSPPGALGTDWEIEIAQGGLAKPQDGSLRASWRGETLATTSWRLVDGRRAMSVNLSWPSSRLPVSSGGEPILWEVVPQGDDALTLDNAFRTSVTGRGGAVLIIAEPSGELPLEDPANGLLTVLRVIGLQADRVDFSFSRNQKIKSDQAESNTKPILVEAIATQNERAITIMLGGLGHGVDSFCREETAGNHNWIVPWGESIDHGELCECAARLMKKADSHCQDIHSRDQWLEWLASVGGKQIGGEVGQTKNTVAFRLPDGNAKRNILALTVSLTPSRTFGIDYGRFPLLVKELLAIDAKDIKEGGLGMNSNDDWLRENDISSFLQVEKNSERVFAEQNQLRLTNVPIGESLLGTLPLTQLPPLWSDARSDVRQRGSGKLDVEDPLPWLRMIILLVLSAMVLDLVWNIWRRRQLTKAAGTLLIFLFSIYAQDSFAQVQMDFFHVPAAQAMTFTRVGREVSARTSIEVAAKGYNFENLDQAAESPWLWIRSPERMVDSNGQMTAEMIRWLKRGGFLVVESTGSDDVKWEQFTKPLMTGTFKPTGWRPVPQDHELMRSFYLLETLPACNGKIWKWFGLDGRLAILQAPYQFSGGLQDQAVRMSCDGIGTTEYQTRVFVNILMVALTTDYKRDQIHLPEILKRLRLP